MNIIRDDSWYTCLEKAKKLGKKESDAVFLADCTWRMKKKYEAYNTSRKQREIAVIEKTPCLKQVSLTTCKTCSATTMGGKKCGFKAVCGSFCKKHKVSSKVVLGIKC